MISRVYHVNFGSNKTGLTTVGYVMYTTGTGAGSRSTSVVEVGGGVYEAVVSLSGDFQGRIMWDSGETTPLRASEAINPYLLSSTGLDTVALNVETHGGSTAGDTTLLPVLRRLYRRFLRPVSLNSNTLTMQDNNGANISTQAVTTVGGVQTQGSAT